MPLNNLSDWDRSGTLQPYPQSAGQQGMGAIAALMKIFQQQQQDSAMRKAAGLEQGVGSADLAEKIILEKNKTFAPQKPQSASESLAQIELEKVLQGFRNQTQPNVSDALGGAVPGSEIPGTVPAIPPDGRPPQFIPGKTGKYGLPEQVENPDFSLYQKKREMDLQPPTDTQTISAGFAKRMEQAEEPISKIKSLGLGSALMNAEVGPNIPWAGIKPVKWPNAWKPEEAQTFDQAKRNFVNAVLRKESGAVISPEEFKNADLQYFPQPGDKPEVIKQKAENRRLALESIKQSAGKAYTKEILNEEMATKILQEAGGDKNKAREIATQRGYKF